MALAQILKARHGIDAVPVGCQANAPSTLYFLASQWADLIIQMQPWNLEQIWKDQMSKVRIMDVGVDIWSNSMHPDLHAILIPFTDEWAARGWRI